MIIIISAYHFDILQTDGVHELDDKHPSSKFPETSSEAVKVLKGEYVIRAIEEQNMDQGLCVSVVVNS